MAATNRFPTLTSYLAELPHGLDSYPELRAKASLYRSMADTLPIPVEDRPHLPGPLRMLVESPAPVSSWIAEVHSHAVLLAIYDRCFDSEAQFLELAYRRQRELFSSRLYAVAMKIVSPHMLIKSATLRWRMFHRGVGLERVDQSATSASLQLTYPAGVYDALTLQGLCAGFRAALDLAAGKRTVVELTGRSSEHAVITARW